MHPVLLSLYSSRAGKAHSYLFLEISLELNSGESEMGNILLRPVWNKAEMLKLSIDYEKVAREHHDFSSDIYTIFVAEYGTTPDVMRVVSEYPFDYELITRPSRFGLTANIMEGYKVAFSRSDSFVITVEDDILIHRTYFEYIDALFALGRELPKFSVINADGGKRGGPSYIKRAHHYGPAAPLIDKGFFEKYVLPHANPEYYNNRVRKMTQLNRNYLKYHESGRYKFHDVRFDEQAGLINRLVDHAMIDEGIYVLTPEVRRERNIGYFGKNRPGGSIPGNSFDERFENLTNIVKDPKVMVEHAGTEGREGDYALFNPSLDTWNGEMKLRRPWQETIYRFIRVMTTGKRLA